MTIKKDMLIGFTLGMVLSASMLSLAQAPAVDIGNRHGNLRAAQQYILSAWQRIGQAQRDNDGQLAGHAQRAKNLLVEANEELRLAANVSNAEGR